MINPDHYVYKVIWSVEDQEYVGLCAEYPSLSYLHEDRLQALESLLRVTLSLIQSLGRLF